MKFYRCNECGNMFLVLIDPSNKPCCCNFDMVEVLPNQKNEDGEKHLPVIELLGKKAIVSVGAKSHPMETEHRIEWIALTDGPRVDIQRLKLDEAPVADFTIRNHSERLRAYAFCNQHGLWESDET